MAFDPRPAMLAREVLHYAFPRQLASMMLSMQGAPLDGTVALVQEGREVVTITVAEVVPLLRDEMARRQRKAANRQGGGT